MIDTVLQSGIPRTPALPPGVPLPPAEGMVTAVYFSDDPAVPPARARQVLVDVQLVGGGFCAKIPVAQHGSSVRNGSLWVPEAPRGTISGEPLRLVPDGDGPGTALEDMDGDFVLVIFRGPRPQSGVVTAALPHPGMVWKQAGAEPKPLPTYTAGEAERLSLEPDGRERWLAHQGTVARVDRAGNLRIDLADAGKDNGGRAAIADGEAAGWVDLNMKPGARLILRSGGVPVFVFTAGADGQLTLDVGKDAGERAILGDSFMPLFDRHRHYDWSGMTGAVVVEDRMATAQGDAATATLSERVKLPRAAGGDG